MELNSAWKTFGLVILAYQPWKESASGIAAYSLERNIIIFGVTGFILFLIIQLIKWKRSLVIKEGMLEKANKANEKLISELNHRVKNNLQIAISLLKGQATYAEQPDVAEAINEGCNRLYVMSLAFHSLYEGELLSAIDLKDYLGKLVYYLADEYMDRPEIAIESNIASYFMDIAQAIPLGLIISEAVNNAYKFAFPDGMPGCIAVTVESLENAVMIKISDNGVGLPEPGWHTQPPTFGFDLIKGLGKQISAHVKIENAQGVTISLEITQPGCSLTKE